MHLWEGQPYGRLDGSDQSDDSRNGAASAAPLPSEADDDLKEVNGKSSGVTELLRTRIGLYLAVLVRV
jgi:hypothetical protein